MSSMIESIMGMLSKDNIGNISSQIGVTENKTKEVLPDILAVLTGALAKNSSDTQEAKSISNALEKDHDGSLLNNISDYINDYKQADGDGILRHVLGSKRVDIEKSLSKKEGLDMSSISNMLTMAAPIIMGILGKRQRQDGLNANSLSNILGQESNQAQNMLPGIKDILSQTLGKSNQPQPVSQTNKQDSQPVKKRSAFVTIIIIIVIVALLYFLLRACGIL